MQYFQLTFDLNEEEVGHVPQVDRTNGEWNIHDNSFQGKEEDAKLITELPVAFLHKKAFFTDLLSSSALGIYGMLVSGRLKHILEEDNESYCGFLPLQVQDASGISQLYWYLAPVGYDYDQLDYQKTLMSVIGKANRKIMRYAPKSADELLSMIEILKPPQVVSIDSPIFLPECEKPLLALNFVQGGTGFYLSEGLKKRVDVGNYTGIKFRALQPALHPVNN